MNPLEKNITVNILRGVHGRVATRLAQIAQQHDVRLCIISDGKEIDCLSLLDVLSMALVSGARVKFRVYGQGGAQAMTDVEMLFAIEGEP